jgi:rubrerythrin
MDLGAILLLLAVLIMVVLFVGRPLMIRQAASNKQAHAESSLLAERDRVLTALQELDFDNTLGKIPAEDYPAQRAVLVQRGAEVLRQLDELKGKRPAQSEARVEAAVAARRETAKPARQKAASEDDLEDLIARRRQARKEKTAGFCPKCGKPVMRSDKFCPGCGYALK